MKSGGYIFLIQLTFIILLIAPFGRGRKFGSAKGIVTTIKVGDKDMIDCIDVHKQLAFTHPLLINHTIQMEPSIHGLRSKLEHGTLELKQSWHKYGRCPEGSIPISRKHKKDVDSLITKLAHTQDAQNHHQVKRYEVGTIYGAHATLNLWNPAVNPMGESISQLWLVAGDGTNLNTIEAGWQVYDEGGRYQPRLFIYWTRDNYESTGCFDLTCPGFVQVSKDIIVGAYLNGYSVYDGKQSEILLNIQKDQPSGNWWLSVGGTAVGYWPSALFTSMANGADVVSWGGEVFDVMAKGNNTITQMGNGHFSSEGYGKSSYIRDIKYTDYSGSEVHPTQQDLEVYISAPSCYDCQLHPTSSELYLLFGGPGCPSS